MFIHTVYFWFEDDLDSQALAAAEEGLQSLTKDPSVHHGMFGKPADTHRSVVDNTYTYGLVVKDQGQATMPIRWERCISASSPSIRPNGIASWYTILRQARPGPDDLHQPGLLEKPGWWAGAQALNTSQHDGR